MIYFFYRNIVVKLTNLKKEAEAVRLKKTKEKTNIVNSNSAFHWLCLKLNNRKRIKE